MARNLKYYGMDPASGPDRTSVTLYDWQTEYYIADPAINEPLPPKLADLINETMRKLLTNRRRHVLIALQKVLVLAFSEEAKTMPLVG